LLGRFAATPLLTLLGAVVLQILLLSSQAHALPETPDNTWMTNGTVFAQALSEDGNTLYIGGRFTVVKDRADTKVAANNLAAVDVATGEIVRSWRPRATGDGAVVHSIAVKDGRVFVGGNFSAVDGQPRNNIAEVEPTDGSLKPFAPEITYVPNDQPPAVNTMLLDGSRLYVGGDFNAADGKSRPRLAAFSLATGALDTDWKPEATRVVKDMEFDSTGETIIAVGRFATVTGSDGTSASRYTVARFYTDTGNIHPWAIPDGVIGETVQTGWDVLVTPTRIFAGFGDKGANYAAAFRLDDGDVGSQVWRFAAVGDVQALGMSPDGTRLFFGGHFGLNRADKTVCGNRQLEGLASLDPNTGELYCDWLPQLRPTENNGNGPRAEMVVTNDSHLWVGGGFTEVSGVAQSNLARFPLVDNQPSCDDVPPCNNTDDTVRPTVTKASPTGNRVSPKANATATFSEAMDPATLDGATFRLVRKGSAKALAARVTYSAATAKATLNPVRNLKSGASYKATVKAGAKDAAGNALVAKAWYFKVR
jgi:hypothetical protein